MNNNKLSTSLSEGLNFWSSLDVASNLGLNGEAPCGVVRLDWLNWASAARSAPVLQGWRSWRFLIPNPTESKASAPQR